MPFVSVVVLGYKAGVQLQNLVTRLKLLLKKTRWEYEIILVANYWLGKNDPTPSVALKISQSTQHVDAISRPKQGGMGWDVLSGLKQARGEVLVFVDGDAQNPIEDVVRTVHALQRKKADLAKTVRVQRFDGAVRAVQSVWYNRFFRLMYGININDVNGKPKAMTRTLLQRLNLSSTDWFIDAEIVYKTFQLGGKIIEIPTVFYMNPTRSSFVNFKTTLEFLKNMVRYWIHPPIVA